MSVLPNLPSGVLCPLAGAHSIKSVSASSRPDADCQGYTGVDSYRTGGECEPVHQDDSLTCRYVQGDRAGDTDRGSTWRKTDFWHDSEPRLINREATRYVEVDSTNQVITSIRENGTARMVQQDVSAYEKFEDHRHPGQGFTSRESSATPTSVYSKDSLGVQVRPHRALESDLNLTRPVEHSSAESASIEHGYGRSVETFIRENGSASCESLSENENEEKNHTPARSGWRQTMVRFGKRQTSLQFGHLNHGTNEASQCMPGNEKLQEKVCYQSESEEKALRSMKTLLKRLGSKLVVKKKVSKAVRRVNESAVAENIRRTLSTLKASQNSASGQNNQRNFNAPPLTSSGATIGFPYPSRTRGADEEEYGRH